MDKNTVFIIIIRFVIIAIYMLILNKYLKARKMDPNLKFRFDIRSIAELVLVSGINLAVLALPINSSTSTFILLGGQVMIVVTYFHLRRIVVFGKKVAFLLEHSFLIPDIKNFKYKKGKMTFLIKNVPLSIRFPLADMNYLHERLSGKYYKKK